jgi:hypothetical protein
MISNPQPGRFSPRRERHHLYLTCHAYSACHNLTVNKYGPVGRTSPDSDHPIRQCARLLSTDSDRPPTPRNPRCLTGHRHHSRKAGVSAPGQREEPSEEPQRSLPHHADHRARASGSSGPNPVATSSAEAGHSGHAGVSAGQGAALNWRLGQPAASPTAGLAGHADEHLGREPRPRPGSAPSREFGRFQQPLRSPGFARYLRIVFRSRRPGCPRQ